MFIFGFLYLNLVVKSSDYDVGNCMKNGRCKGHMLQFEKAENYHECFKKCQNTTRCSWISYDGNEKECYQYSICDDVLVKVYNLFSLIMRGTTFA